MKKIVLLLISLVAVSQVSAGGVTAEISRLLFYEQGDLLYIYPKGGTGAIGSVACHGGNGDYISYKLSRPRAKEYIAALSMAFAANKRVTFFYNDACVDQSVSVTLRYILVHQ